ncbi:MAG: hypothetical protein QOD86_2973 [Miltoncostaeaceae bacterium]|nr:hypothetical protein [Miltoncostaeaceae bacterium]
MSDGLDLVYRSIDEQHADASPKSRRQFVTGAAATLGGLGLLSVPGLAMAQKAVAGNDPQTILNIAATAEVLATIVNTVGWEKGLGTDDVTQGNIAAAAREELIHYNVLISKGVGGRPLTKKIWVPDAVFADRTSLLSTLEVGDQIFINAYLIGVTTFGQAGNGTLARIAAEFMGAEAVHRALARQSLGKLGNDRVFMKYSQRETAKGAPNKGSVGFTKIGVAAEQLQAAGFGFGAKGATPGRFYDFDAVSKRTPNPAGVNTPTPK